VPKKEDQMLKEEVIVFALATDESVKDLEGVIGLDDLSKLLRKGAVATHVEVLDARVSERKAMPLLVTVVRYPPTPEELQKEEEARRQEEEVRQQQEHAMGRMGRKALRR
jgi:hypothetical protein